MYNPDYWKLYLRKKKLNATDPPLVLRIEDPKLMFKVVIYQSQDDINYDVRFVWLLEQTTFNRFFDWRSFNPSNHPYFVDQPWVSTIHRNEKDDEIMNVSEEELHVILNTCTRINKLVSLI